MQTLRNEIRKLTLAHNCNPTDLSCVTVYRFTEEKLQMPLVDPRITLVAGGYPLFVNGKIAGGIGVGGGTEAEDCEIAEYVVSVFEKTAC